MMPDLLKKRPIKNQQKKPQQHRKLEKQDKKHNFSSFSREDKKTVISAPQPFTYKSCLLKYSNHKWNCSNVSAIKTILCTSACLGADKSEYLGLAGCKTDQVQAPASHVSTTETTQAHKIRYISLDCLVVTQLDSFQAQITRSKHRGDVSALDIPSMRKVN